MNLKKAIAILTATVLLTMGTVSVASAGGIFDTIKSAACTFVSGIKTAGNAVVGAGKYVFTDADGDECFADMKKSANDTANNYSEMNENAIKAIEDLADFNAGMQKMITGAIATGGAAIAETVINTVTGNDDYSWTESASNMVKEGYEKYDAGWETVADIASLTGPIGSTAVSGMRVLKKAGEAAVGYKDTDWDDVGGALKTAAVNTVITAVTGGVGTTVSGVVSGAESAFAGSVAGAVTKTAINTALDLADSDNDRDVLTTILEDVTTGVFTSEVSIGGNIVVK